jgi:hypothetical protein
MPQILTSAANLRCFHTGPGVSVPSSSHWQIGAGLALVEGDTGTLTCPFLACPCKTYTLHSMSLNSLELDGKKVVLTTDFNISDTGLPLLISETHNVFDDSTPAPYTGAALPPQLIDPTTPVVSAGPATASYTLSSHAPAPIVITFTLAAAFPLRWLLTLISIPSGTSKDLTNGAPGATPSPSAGSWAAPSQTVVLTLDQSFLDTLPSGNHIFYLTAVNQRGSFSVGLATLTVI